MVAGMRPPARHLLSQHSPTWGERSSPGELIHPGECKRTIGRIEAINGEAQRCVQDSDLYGRAVIATSGGPIDAFRFARLSGRFADVAADLAQ